MAIQSEIKISLVDFTKIQFGLVTLLVAIGFLNYLLPEPNIFGTPFRTLNLFDVGHESSLQTWFSSVNLAVSALFLYMIYLDESHHGFNNKYYWLLLSFCLLLLSIDESSELHERLNRFTVSSVISLSVLQLHPWILYGSILTSIFGIVFVPFLIKIDRRTAILFLISGFVFVTGALGFEMVGVIMKETGFANPDDLIYKFRRVIEEGLELYGVALFNYAAFRELTWRNASFGFQAV